MSTRQSDVAIESPRMTLGAFLRARRERLSPNKAGLPTNARRRTPGLRREEVAMLSSISPEWYTYLEQDRDIRPSLEVLDRIATALQLSPAERQYIRTLAFPKSRTCTADALPVALQVFIDDLEYKPAYVVNDFWDIVGWNAIAARLFPGLQVDAHPNLVTSVFLNSAWRRLYVDWEASARKMLALFRLTVATHANDDRCLQLISTLSASPEFSAWWPKQDVLASTPGNKQMNHPEVGTIDLDYTSFRSLDDPALTMIVFRPRDEVSMRNLKRLHG